LYTTAAERNRFSRAPDTFKDVSHIVGIAGLHQKTGKMAARDRTAVRQLQRPFPGARDPRFFQPLGDLLTRIWRRAFCSSSSAVIAGWSYRYSARQYESRDFPRAWKSRRR
jgi:hypothetical protein